MTTCFKHLHEIKYELDSNIHQSLKLQHRLDQETLDEQYNTVRSKTKGSHVMKYGATVSTNEIIKIYTYPSLYIKN